MAALNARPRPHGRPETRGWVVAMGASSSRRSHVAISDFEIASYRAPAQHPAPDSSASHRDFLHVCDARF